VFASPAQLAGSAAARLRDTADLFSAREAMAIAFQAVSELKGGVLAWMAVEGIFHMLPFALVGEKIATPRDAAVFSACLLLSSWVNYGLSRVALEGVRGQAVQLRRAFLSPRIFGLILLTQLVIAVPVFIGALLFIAPGVYLMLVWSQIGFLIIDGRARGMDALKASEALTRDRRFEILIALAVPALLSLASKPLESLAPAGGSLLSPGFLLFLVSVAWQSLAVTFGVWVSAVVYQMLLNHRRDRAI
jgi:hypothetical protein